MATPLPNDNRRLSHQRGRITHGRHNQCLQLDKFEQPRLLLLLREIAAGRADEQHIRHAGLLGRLDQLRRDVELILVSKRGQADGIRARLLQRVDPGPVYAGRFRHRVSRAPCSAARWD